ncbi:hypothetical protein GWK36_01690 [Caldichromatium japonicum]|uniref:Uncharacterized protein n=1 Tax=Caldichromatium japonicum TaxID=2699430 RepID=A0A6G7VA30_9GAMM|nr:hypothetical protein [Caldichromatium japonicum]QIK36923.1 hypothetical protein GWK36_01690 [Caldichromatium japonicum]
MLEVILDDDADFEHKLLQIAQGRLILTVAGIGYQPGQSLLLLVGQMHDATALPLRAHILRVIEIPPLDPLSAVNRPPLVDLEWNLAHPPNELRTLTELFRSASRSRGSSP